MFALPHSTITKRYAFYERPKSFGNPAEFPNFFNGLGSIRESTRHKGKGENEEKMASQISINILLFLDETEV